MSIKSEMYQLVKSKLESIMVSGETLFKYVGHYNGQDADLQNNFAYRTPAAFIGFTQINWIVTKHQTPESNINREQDGLIEFAIHYFIHDLQTDTDSFLNHLSIIDLSYRHLIGLRSDSSILGKVSSLRRVREIDQPTNNNLRHWISYYSTRLQETGENDNLVNAQPYQFIIVPNPSGKIVQLVEIDDNTLLAYDNDNNKITTNG